MRSEVPRVHKYTRVAVRVRTPQFHEFIETRGKMIGRRLPRVKLGECASPVELEFLSAHTQTHKQAEKFHLLIG